MSLIVISLFLFNIYSINGLTFEQLTSGWTNKSLSVITRILLTPIGATLAVLSLLLINRNKKQFIYYAMPSAILLTINSLMSQLMFDAMKWLSVGTILFIQCVIWSRKKEEGYMSISIEYWQTILIGITLMIIGLSVGIFGVSNIPDTSLFYNKKPVLDPLQFTFTLAGNIMMIFFVVQSRIIYLIGNLLTWTMFLSVIINGDLLTLILFTQISIYMMITISGYLTMFEKHATVCEKNRVCKIV